MKDTLEGRTIGILVADGSNGAVIDKVRKAAVDAGAMVKIVAPRVCGAKPSKESGTIDFVHNAFSHLKAIIVDKGGQDVLQKANIERDKGVVNSSDIPGFIAAAKTRQWDREASVRVLA